MPVTKPEQDEKRETRILQVADIEMRVEPGDDDKPGKLTGYAAKFNSDSEDMWGVIEQIKPGAFANALVSDDVRALVNHDPNLLLGRTSAGTLQLKETGTGLQFENDLPDTQAGRDIAESVSRGDITGCSFAFTVAKDEWDYEADPIRRTIVEVGQLFDVGPVTYPAYPDTSVVGRSITEHNKQEKEVPPVEPEAPPVEPEKTPLEILQAQRADERRREDLEKLTERLGITD